VVTSATGVVALGRPRRPCRRVHDACEEIALGEMGLDVYANRIEVISSEQMLDA